MRRTGAFLEDPAALYEGKRDPIELNAWSETRRPVMLHGDARHFFQATPELLGLRQHPLTRAPILSAAAFEPIVHRGTRFDEYVALLRDLRARGWCDRAGVRRDLAAALEARRAQGPPLLGAADDDADDGRLLWARVMMMMGNDNNSAEDDVWALSTPRRGDVPASAWSPYASVSAWPPAELWAAPRAAAAAAPSSSAEEEAPRRWDSGEHRPRLR